MHLCVQTVAACPFGRLTFRDNLPCRLVVAGEEDIFMLPLRLKLVGGCARAVGLEECED
jgi:hypothetical protein